MLDTENMQIVSRLLAITLERWCSHRAAEKNKALLLPRACPKAEELPRACPEAGHLQRCLPPLCASATNSLYYIIFYRLKPLKSGRYHSILIYGPPSRNFCTSA